MKTVRLVMMVVAGWRLVAADHARASEWFVHEWGTFTSVVAATGQMLSGLENEEEAVPAFVHSFPGFAPLNKGLILPVRGATVKMETPVLYFYSSIARRVRVDVTFNGGTISQWYPERSGGEMPPRGPILNLSGGYLGRAEWQVDVLARDSSARINTRSDWETPQWPRARVAAANLVRAPSQEVEGFIFYRGVGNFPLPLRVMCNADGTVVLENTGGDRMPFVWVYEKPRQAGEPTHQWFGPLASGRTERVAAAATSTHLPAVPLHAALVEAGLSSAEATALLSTWRESYFDRPGLRVFWIVPRAFTDSVLPISINPKPDALVRVLVGRTEVLTPSFEREVAQEFAADGGKRFESDRYFQTYRERARQLGAIVAVAPAAITP